MKKFNSIALIMLCIIPLCAHAAEPAKEAHAGPTTIEFLTAQRQTILERMQKLEAQYQFSQWELAEINVRITAEKAKFEDKKKAAPHN